jgi:Domain of unknown function (DUF4845)
MQAQRIVGQRGISLVGLIFVLAILGVLGVLALKIVPTVTEYMAIKKAIMIAKNAGSSVPEIRASFDKQADTSYIDSIAGKDLTIVNSGDGFVVSFSYEKKIPLVGPASLALDYEGSTAPGAPAKGAGE